MTRLLEYSFFLILSFLLSTSCSRSFDTDVLVVGGGVSGVPAAIQAAEAGCSTTLVESGGCLGGTMVTGGVRFPGLFHAWGKQVISGIGWQLVCEAVKMDGGRLPDFSVPCGSNHPAHQIMVNAALYSALAEERCVNSGVKLRYYETPLKVRKIRNGWEVTLTGKGLAVDGCGLVKLRCRQIIDATGGATVAGMAGCERMRGSETQPGSLIFELSGYNPSALDFDLLQSMLDKARSDGTLTVSDCYSSIRTLLLPHEGRAVSHVPGADSSTSETHTLANMEGRASLLRLVRVLKTFPGLEGLTVKYMAGETAVRETWRIKGVVEVSGEDYIEGKVFDDAVAYSFYPIDLHDENGVEPRHLEEGVMPTVPLGALVPAGCSNIIVAGRSICSDRLANSALRVQATSMATGQVAGAAAALACREKCSPGDVSLDALRTLLSSSGAIVPGM